MKLVRMTEGPEADGAVHIDTVDTVNAFETLCGFCDTANTYEEVPLSTRVTCRECWSVYTYCREGRRLKGAP